MPEKLRKTLTFVARLLVSGGLLGLILWKVNAGAVLRELTGANPLLLAAALGSTLLAYVVASARWWVLLKAHVPDVELREVIEATFAGLFLGNVLPSGAGVDLVRGGFLMAKGVSGSVGFGSIFVDRMVGMLLLSALAAVGLWNKPGLRPVGIAALLGVSLVGAVFFSRRFGRLAEKSLGKVRAWNAGPRLVRFLEAVRLYRQEPSRLVAAAGLSVLLQALLATAALAASVAMDQHVPPHLHYLYVPAVNLLAMIPVTLAGIGVREGGFAFFYSGVLEPRQAVALSLAYYLVSVAPTLLGALPLVGTKLTPQRSKARRR